MVLGVESVQYNRDIRPILSDNCFECHGPDAAKRKADLRLDIGDEGKSVVVAGKPEASELFKRISHSDSQEKMPPEDSGRVLTESEVETLRRWIEQGARWEKHWAFIPPIRPPLPVAGGSG